MAIEPAKISELTQAQRLASKVALLGYRELVFDVEINFYDEELISQTIIQTDGLNILPEYLESRVIKLNNLTSQQFGNSDVRITVKTEWAYTCNFYYDANNYFEHVIVFDKVSGSYLNETSKFRIILRIYE